MPEQTIQSESPESKYNGLAQEISSVFGAYEQLPLGQRDFLRVNSTTLREAQTILGTEIATSSSHKTLSPQEKDIAGWTILSAQAPDADKSSLEKIVQQKTNAAMSKNKLAPLTKLATHVLAGNMLHVPYTGTTEHRMQYVHMMTQQFTKQMEELPVEKNEISARVHEKYNAAKENRSEPLPKDVDFSVAAMVLPTVAVGEKMLKVKQGLATLKVK